VPWYQIMKFQKVYVQGYGFGTIADTGGGIPGTPWIDLGFDDDNYVSWHNWTTMYFLPPIPAWVPVSLP
jgi:3D (Asp-Asp-Asp) domain-containing protein